MDPNKPQNPLNAGNDQANKFIPPEPGQYQPQPHDQLQQQPAVESQREIPKPNLYADNQIIRKKKQARMFIIAAAAFTVLFIVGIVVLAASFGGDDEIGRNEDLSVNEQLELDANNLGLAIINYNNGNEPFELTPGNATELSVGYLPQDFVDPRTDEPYTLVTSIPQVGEMQYIIGGICNQDDSISQGGDADGFAVRVLLEDEEQLYCREKSEITQPEQPAP